MRKVKAQGLIKWFDRKFDSNVSIDHFGEILRRLENFPVVLHKWLKTCPKAMTTFKSEGKWSVNENIGHLTLLESLWRRRFQDIKDEKQDMFPADLNNTATEQASFNTLAMNDLINRLAYERAKTIALLRQISKDDLLKKSTHPRLNLQMTIVDLMYFVAEHDDHHMQAIQFIKN